MLDYRLTRLLITVDQLLTDPIGCPPRNSGLGMHGFE